jgi:hypothetical protein
MRRLILVSSLAALASFAPWPAAADTSDFTHGRIRFTEAGVVLQRASEAGAEEAIPNLPFLPGDRVWTDDSARVEFQFTDGSLVRLDTRSKLDYVAHDEGRDERVVLRLWSGGVILSSRAARALADFSIETPAGLVEIVGGSDVRVDLEGDEVRVSVYEGEATLDAGRGQEVIRTGERTYARPGEEVAEPERFDRNAGDPFTAWSRDRDASEVRAADSRRYLPEEVAPYAGELESHGDWYYESEVGFVWRPFVVTGWRPYWDGRWVWSAYGWTWVPNEPWGWAPFHYGRWGHSGALGWYWIPGRTWGPAWVSWAVGPQYVGWCPLGRHDRAVVVDRPRDHAVPRGSFPAGTSSWTYERRGDIGARHAGHKRAELEPGDLQTLQVVESPEARPTRDFARVVRGPVAVPRGSAQSPRTVGRRPTIGDTVPELRADPSTTIPVTAPRRAVGRSEPAAPAARESVAAPRDPGRESRRPVWTQREDTPSSAPKAPDIEGRRPTQPAPSPSDSSRDVLRRMFRPLSEAQGNKGSGDSERARPRSESPRSEGARTAPPRREPSRGEVRTARPKQETPRAAPRQQPASGSHSAPRPSKKDKD